MKALESSVPGFERFDCGIVTFGSDNTGIAASRPFPVLSLPNVTIPQSNLSNPGTELSNAFKANFVYTRIVQVAKSPFSGANNYAWLLNHDLPNILANRFTI